MAIATGYDFCRNTLILAFAVSVIAVVMTFVIGAAQEAEFSRLIHYQEAQGSRSEASELKADRRIEAASRCEITCTAFVCLVVSAAGLTASSRPDAR